MGGVWRVKFKKILFVWFCIRSSKVYLKLIFIQKIILLLLIKFKKILFVLYILIRVFNDINLSGINVKTLGGVWRVKFKKILFVWFCIRSSKVYLKLIFIQKIILLLLIKFKKILFVLYILIRVFNDINLSGINVINFGGSLKG